MFFDSWSQLARVAAVTPVIYFGLILFIRVSESGLSRLDDARWVILETDASFSVIPRSDAPADPTALAGVRGVERGADDPPSVPRP